MTMKIKLITKQLATLIAILATASVSVFSQPISDAQKEAFRTEVEKLMKTYNNVASLTNSEGKVDLGKIGILKGMFIETPKNIVFNDLLPQKVEGDKYLNPTSYTQYASRYYPEGLDIIFIVENISFEPLPVKGTYTAIVKTKKVVRGFYDSKRIHSYDGNLFFYVNAKLTGTEVSNLGISFVADPEKHAQMQSNKSMGGLYAGLSGSFSNSMLFNTTIFTNDKWDAVNGNNMLPSIEVFYMITKGFGVGTGIRFGKYSTTLKIDNYNNQLSNPVTDDDNDEYYPIFSISELQELNMINSIDIPIFLKFRGGKGKTGFYFDIGAIYSKLRSATYTLDGSASVKGYYPEYNVTLENIPEYNFSTQEFNAAEEDMNIPSSNLSVATSMVLSFMVYRDITLRVGVNATFGLTDLMYYESRHPFDFYATTGLDGDKTNILTVGAEIGVYYRIFSGF